VVCTKPYLVPFCARPMRPRDWESLRNWRLVQAILATAGLHPRPDLSTVKTQKSVLVIEVTATHLSQGTASALNQFHLIFFHIRLNDKLD